MNAYFLAGHVYCHLPVFQPSPMVTLLSLSSNFVCDAHGMSFSVFPNARLPRAHHNNEVAYRQYSEKCDLNDDPRNIVAGMRSWKQKTKPLRFVFCCIFPFDVFSQLRVHSPFSPALHIIKGIQCPFKIVETKKSRRILHVCEEVFVEGEV